MIKILIADDHAIVREGLKQIVAEVPDMVVAGEASNGEETLQEVQRADYDVVLLDISMPGQSGMETLKELGRRRSGLPVLMLSMHPEEQYAVRALRAGARGYLTKESAPNELVVAIRKVVNGDRYVSSLLSERLASDLTSYTRETPYRTLSDREYQVLRMIASGKTVNNIATELALSVKTVSTYRSRILTKLRMKTTAELIRYAIEKRLVS